MVGSMIQQSPDLRLPLADALLADGSSADYFADGRACLASLIFFLGIR
jgi:hypothetical protein